MVDYNDGKWHGWNGGECPVHPETVIEIIYNDIFPVREDAVANNCEWKHDAIIPIIAFRVIKEHKESHIGLVNFSTGEFRWVTDDYCDEKYILEGYVYVREVLE